MIISPNLFDLTFEHIILESRATQTYERITERKLMRLKDAFAPKAKKSQLQS